MAFYHTSQASVFEFSFLSPSPYFIVSPSSSCCCLCLNSHWSSPSASLSVRSSSALIRKLGLMAASSSSSPRRLVTSDYLRHVESMKKFPSGAGRIAHLNGMILGDSLASEENDLIFPSEEFTKQALISSPEQVNPLLLLLRPFLITLFFSS